MSLLRNIQTDHTTSQDYLQLKYLSQMRKVLLTAGAWADEPFGAKSPWITHFQRKTFVLQSIIILIGIAYYVTHNLDKINIFSIGHIIITASISSLLTIRSLITNFKGYDLIIKNFVEFHLMNHTQKGSHYQRINELTNKISHYFTQFQMALLLIGPILFNITPVYEDYSRGVFTRPRPENLTLDFAVFYAYPGFSQDDHFFISTLLNAYLSYQCGVLICIYDLLLSLMVFQIIGHTKTLIIDLETIEKPKTIFGEINDERNTDKSSTNVLILHKYDKEENDALQIQLAEMINHHRLIVRFANRMGTFFGPMLAYNFFYHLLSGCILLLECLQHDPKALARFGPLTFIIFGQLIQISVVFEIVGYMSEKLMNSVYLTPWESMDIRNQRTLQFLLHRVQTPIQVRAMGMVPIGVQTMQGILKTTLSYLAILQSFSD